MLRVAGPGRRLSSLPSWRRSPYAASSASPALLPKNPFNPPAALALDSSDSSGSSSFNTTFYLTSAFLHQITGCYKSRASSSGNIGSSILGNLSQKLASLTVKENLSLPCALSFRSFIHSGDPDKAETENISRPMDYVRKLIGESGDGRFGRSPLSPYSVEQNADIVHIKMLRNNTFITLTDSKGNRKPGVRVSASAGSLPDKGGKVSRYGAEATAEHVGREARKSGVKSVVVKVNGFTYFKKKRQAIMAFREGYTHGRGDQTPIVHIEDTTRQPHNGCRLPKKRRI